MQETRHKEIPDPSEAKRHRGEELKALRHRNFTRQQESFLQGRGFGPQQRQLPDQLKAAPLTEHIKLFRQLKEGLRGDA